MKRNIRKKIKKVLSIGLASFMVIGMFSSAVSIHAEEVSADEVFNKNDVLALKMKAKNEIVYQDYKLTSKVAPANKTNLKRATAAKGTYPTRKGVILVTADAYKELIPTGHAAIIYSSDRVIEAMSDGVRYWKNNWDEKKTTCYAVSTYDTSKEQDKQAAEYCKGKIKKPYNYNYYNIGTRKKFYCSHLVRSAFLDKFKIDLNTKEFDIGKLKAVHPLELAVSDETYMIYSKN